MYTVYKHTTPSGKVYIGITKQNPEKRWNNGNGYKNNEHFYHAILKYGWENIKHDIVETGLTKEQACAKEIELIAKYDATNPCKGYNHSTGGECSALGVHQSAETRRKRSEALKGTNNPWYGKRHSAETRRKISEAHKRAYLNNPEYRRKLSEAHKGVNNPNYGKHKSAETRRKLSESKKGFHHSPETKRKISEAHKGKPSPMRGKHLSAEARQKIGGLNAKAVICVETGTLYSSVTEAEKSIGVTNGTICKVLHGINKTSGGYHWKYAER